MIAALALASVLQQASPNATQSEDSLYDALIRKTNELEAFVAVYKAKSSSDEIVDSVRIAYRAPGELRFEGMGAHMTARDGVLTVRVTSPEGKDFWSRSAWEDLSEKGSGALAEAIATEFEAQRASWTYELGCGPMFQFAIPTTDGGKHDRFDLSLNYICPRGALLEWLVKFKRSPDVSIAGDDRRVLKTPNGSEVTLSTRTGFLESMIRKDDRGTASIELETLDLHPKFDDKTFEPASRPEGVEDSSAAFTNHIGQMLTVTLAKKFGSWISSRVSSESLEWNADARVNAGRVLEKLAGDAITSSSATWQSGTREWIDRLGQWIRATYPSGDGKEPEMTTRIEEQIEKGRERLVQSLKGYEEQRPPSPFFDVKDVPETALRTDLDGLLRDAWTKAFAQVLHDPLLQAFDEQVSKAKAGG